MEMVVVEAGQQGPAPSGHDQGPPVAAVPGVIAGAGVAHEHDGVVDDAHRSPRPALHLDVGELQRERRRAGVVGSRSGAPGTARRHPGCGGPARRSTTSDRSAWNTRHADPLPSIRCSSSQAPPALTKALDDCIEQSTR